MPIKLHEIAIFKGSSVFQIIISGIHVSFRGCILFINIRFLMVFEYYSKYTFVMLDVRRHVTVTFQHRLHIPPFSQVIAVAQRIFRTINESTNSFFLSQSIKWHNIISLLYIVPVSWSNLVPKSSPLEIGFI